MEFVFLASLIAFSIWYVKRQRGGTPPDPVEHAERSKAALEDAMVKLRESGWLEFQNVSPEELNRRLILLDQAIGAGEQFSAAVEHMDPATRHDKGYDRLRPAYDDRTQTLRLGRSVLQFLRQHYGHWQFDPTEQRLQFDEDALVEAFAKLQADLQDAVRRQQSSSSHSTAEEASPPPETSPSTPGVPAGE